MNNKILIIALIIVSFFVYKNYFSNSDKEEIRNIITELEKNLEYEKALQPFAVLNRLKSIQSILAPEFTGKSIGNEREKKVDIDKIKQGALVAVRYFPKIDIFSLPAIVDVNGVQASASFHVTVSGQDQQGVEFKELFNVTLGFKKINGRWLCSSASTKRLTPEE